MSRPILATIHLDALRHNLAVVRRHAPHSRVLAVIKANAYGHGLMRTALALANADGFGLIELESAVRLREAGCRQRILLLEGCFEASELPVIARHRIATVVHSREQIGMLAALREAAALDVFIKINTGMNRLGFESGAIPAVVDELRRQPAVRSLTLMTHFASADEARGVEWQMQDFERGAAGLDLPRSLANSAAILRHPGTHADWVRPGIMLYGCSPFSDGTGGGEDLQPAMTLESRVIAIQNMKRGEILGYGAMFTADRDTRVGVVACGYADGYPRHAPTGTPVMVGGRMTGTLGRVSMDLLCVDVTDIPEAGFGSRALLWGAEVPVERVAASAGTVGYQLLCALAPRVPLAES